MLAIGDIRKSFQGTAQETARGIIVKINQAVETLRLAEIQLPDMEHLAKQAKTALVGTWLIGAVTMLTILPSTLLVWKPMAGAYATVASLVALLIIALRSSKVRKLALSATILPLAILVLAIYPYNPSSFYRTWVEYDVVLLLAVIYSYLFRQKLAKKYRLTMKQLPHVLPLMIIIGETLGAAGYELLRHQYGYAGTSLPLVASVAVVFAITEELFFRGLIQRQAMKLTNRTAAIALTVIIYIAATIGIGSLLPLAFGALSAATLSTIYSYKRNLLLTTTTNVAMKLTYVGLVATFVLR